MASKFSSLTLFVLLLLSLPAVSATAQVRSVADMVCSGTWRDQSKVWQFGLAVSSTGVVFSRDSSQTGCEPAILTSNGEVTILDVVPGPMGSRPRAYRSWNGSVLYNGHDSGFETNLKTGLMQIADGTSKPIYTEVGIGAGPLFGFQDEFLFRLEDSRDRSLWSYDGDTVERIASIWHENNPVQYQDKLYFSSYFEGFGNELASYDGNVVERRSDLLPGEKGAIPLHFSVANDLLYFRTNASPVSNWFWSYDGEQLARIATNFEADGANIDNITPFNGLTYFSTGDLFEYGRELWVTNGEDYALVADLNPGLEDSTPRPYPLSLNRTDQPFINHDGFLWFYATVDSEQMLFKTDGADVWDGSEYFEIVPNSEFLPLIVGQVEDSIFYWSEDSNSEVWLYEKWGDRRRRLLHESSAPLDDDREPDLLSIVNQIDFAVEFDGRRYFAWNYNLWELSPWKDSNCDINGDGQCDVLDIDAFTSSMRQGNARDINEDGSIDDEDLRFLIVDLNRTYFGDANLDGEFTSSDIVDVFSAGEYEDDLEQNSTWATGDWNGDGEFTTTDLLLAFQGGGYEQGPRLAFSVPEPAGVLPPTLGLVWMALVHRRTNRSRNGV